MSDLIAMRLDVSEAEYHADPCAAPSLSSSLAKILLSKSPLHAQHKHPRMGNGKREEKEEFDIGHLVHKLVLGKGRDVVVIDADDWRTKAAKEQRAAAREAKKIPVLKGAHDNAVAAAAKITERLAAMGILFEGDSEVQIAWQELSNHGPIWCRGMLDHLIVRGGRGKVLDLKTSVSAHPRACTRHVINYGYDVQQAAYTSALARLMPELAGRIDFVFLFAETEAPYAVTPAVLDGVLREHGERGWTKAITEFGACARGGGEWPGYTNGIVTLEAPSWLLADQEIDHE